VRHLLKSRSSPRRALAEYTTNGRLGVAAVGNCCPRAAPSTRIGHLGTVHTEGSPLGMAVPDYLSFMFLRCIPLQTARNARCPNCEPLLLIKWL
jgi:hypothetical protein